MEIFASDFSIWSYGFCNTVSRLLAERHWQRDGAGKGLAVSVAGGLVQRFPVMDLLVDLCPKVEPQRLDLRQGLTVSYPFFAFCLVPDLPSRPVADDDSPSILPVVYRWSDAVPPLVFLRSLAAPISAIGFLLAGCAYGIVIGGHLLVDSWMPLSGGDSAPLLQKWWQWLEESSPLGRALAYWLNPSVLLLSNPSWQTLLHAGAKQAIIVLAWMFPVAIVLRESITECAQRRPTGLLDLCRVLKARGLALFLATWIPLACILMLVGCYWLFGWLGRWNLTLADWASVLAIPLLLASGVLTIGAWLAIPLAWASILTEPICDTFDALSRGYEYVFRRPLHLLIYALAATLLHWAMYLIVSFACIAGQQIAMALYQRGASGGSQPDRANRILDAIPEVYSILMMWALIGALYLLLRHDANEQEIEDIPEQLPCPGSLSGDGVQDTITV